MALRAIIWLLTLALSIGCEGISIYIYFLHEDLDYGYTDIVGVTNAVTTYTPWEIYLQLAMTLMTCVQGSLVNKGYKVYALFRKDYKKSNTTANWSMVKCIFYGMLCVVFFLKFLFSLVDSVAKNAFPRGSFLSWFI